MVKFKEEVYSNIREIKNGLERNKAKFFNRI